MIQYANQIKYRNYKLNLNVSIVSHKSEYTPHISASILVYILKRQYRN